MSKPSSNLWVVCGTFLLPILLVSSAFADIAVQHNVAFNAKKINPYTGGEAIDVDGFYSVIPNDFFNGKIRADLPLIDVDPLAVALEAVLGVSLPSVVKGQVGATVAGSANLSFGYYATAGRLDISYPASANLNVQTIGGGNYVLGNQTYTIGSEFLPGVSSRVVPPQFLVNSGGVGYATAPLGGVSFNDYRAPSFATKSPWASAWLDASAEFHAGIHTKVTALGGLKEWRKDFNLDGKIGDRLFEIDPTGLYVAGEQIFGYDLDQPIGPIQVPGPGGPANLTVRVPNLAVTSDPINGQVLHTHEVKPIATLTGSLEKLIPFVGGFLHNSFGPLEYDLLQLSGGPQIGLYQDMTFTPHAKVRLTFSEPVMVRGNDCGDYVCAADTGPLRQTLVTEYDLGQDILWKPIFSNSSQLTISPTYKLNNTFVNETGIDLSLLIDVKSLSLKAPFFPTPGNTIGPFFDSQMTIPLIDDAELFTKRFTIPMGELTAEPIVVPKHNLGIELGLGDLQLVTSNFVGFDPQGHDIYALTFHRTVVGQNQPRVYQATVTGTYTNLTPQRGGEGDEAFYIESLQDVIVNDPVTSVGYNLGRNICLSGCDLSDWLPGASLGYIDPNPSLGTLYLTELPTDPNIDVDARSHSKLGQYNAPPHPPLPGPASEGPLEFSDRRHYPDTTILVRKNEILPDGIGRFDSFNFGDSGINEAGGVAYYSNLTVVPPGAGTTGFYYADDSSTNKLFRSGEFVPGSSQTIVFFGGSSSGPNELGQVALVTGMSNSFSNSVVLRGGPDGLKTIARNGQTAPGGSGTILDVAGGSLNDAGQVAFWSRVTYPGQDDVEVIYVGDGTSLKEVARQGDSVPSLPGTISSFGYNSINNSGRVVFDAYTTSNVQGLFASDNGVLKAIAVAGGAVPQGGQFNDFNVHDLNEIGQVAVYASFRETLGGPLKFGLFRGDGVSTVQIAREGQLAPDGDGTLTWQSFSSFQLNNSGQVAFRAFVDAATDYQAILVGNGGALTQIARGGVTAPDGNGQILSVAGQPKLNNHGHVAFEGEVSPDEEGIILLYDGVNLIQVVRYGQPLAGSTVNSTSLIGINDDMQVAYRAGLANGNAVIVRFEPVIYWSKPVSGNWGTADNWSLGIEPRDPYDAVIVAENALTVAGPAANRTVKSLTLGAEDSASARLQLASGVTLTAIQGTTIQANGELAGQGTLVGPVFNGGVVTPGASPGVLAIDGDFTQSSAGKLVIEIASPTSYDQLLVSGDITLAGTLSVSLLDGFVPTEGQTFTIFGNQFDALSGAFQSVVFPTFNGLTFGLTQSPGSISLQVVIPKPGDFNSNAVLDAGDIDILSAAVRSGLFETRLDLDGDGTLTEDDRTVWVNQLAKTYFGDANLDDEFNSGDLVQVFVAGQYEDAIADNSGWATGDWDGDADSTSSDLVLAFQDGGYEQGPRTDAAAVPEPGGWMMLLTGLPLWLVGRQRHRPV